MYYVVVDLCYDSCYWI